MRTLDNEELLALTADGCSGKLEQQSQQLLPHHLMVRSYIAQDPGKRADLDGPMIRNGDVMCAIACKCSGACDFCSVWSPRNRAGWLAGTLAQRPDQVLTRKVARDPHAAITISLDPVNTDHLGHLLGLEVRGHGILHASVKME